MVNIRVIFLNLSPLLQILFKWMFDVHLYEFESRDRRNRVYSRIANDLCIVYDEEKRPQGLVVQRAWIPTYFAWVSAYDGLIYVYATKHTIERWLESPSVTGPSIDVKAIERDPVASAKLSYLVKRGDHGHISYGLREISAFTMTSFTPAQQEIYESVIPFYNQNGFCKLFIDGPVGAGKTFFAYLLAFKLRGYLCTSFDPTQPSESIDTLYTSRQYTKSTPLILLMDEVDTILSQIHNRLIQPHKRFRIPVSNKSDWNEMLDKIELGIYPHIILIMCSNVKKTTIDSWDPCYLRSNRTNMSFSM